jgi:hypothetical protein
VTFAAPEAGGHHSTVAELSPAMACASTGALGLVAPAAAGSAAGQDASLPVAAWAGATLPAAAWAGATLPAAAWADAAPAGGAPASTVAAPVMTRPATHTMAVRTRPDLAPSTITTQSYTGRSAPPTINLQIAPDVKGPGMLHRNWLDRHSLISMSAALRASRNSSGLTSVAQYRLKRVGY